MEREAAQDMKQTLKQAALLALKRKKMYAFQISKIAGARNTIETQLSVLNNSLRSVIILKGMGEGASAMKLLHDKATKSNSYVDQQLSHLKEIENVIHIQSEEGSWTADQQFADAVDSSLDNIQTTVPDSLSHLADKEKDLGDSDWVGIHAFSIRENVPEGERVGSQGTPRLHRRRRAVDIQRQGALLCGR